MTATASKLRLSSELRFEDSPVADADGEKQPRFKMLAYSGDVVEQYGSRFVIDLASLQVDEGGVPIFRQHQATRFVGRSDKVERGAQLAVEGFLFVGVQDADEVARMSKQGARWQASVGVDFSWDEVTFIGKDDVQVVNGRPVTGPLEVLRNTRLFEVSFVPLGADPNTSAVTLDDSGRLPARKERRMAAESKSETIDLEAERKKLRDEEQARSAALRKEFQDDPEFALEAIASGKSLLQAQADYAGVLRARLAKANEEKKKLESAPRGASPAAAIGGAVQGVAPAGETFKARFERHVRELRELRRGQPERMIRSEAVQLAAAEDPAGHQEFVRLEGERIQKARSHAQGVAS